MKNESYQCHLWANICSVSARYGEKYLVNFSHHGTFEWSKWSHFISKMIHNWPNQATMRGLADITNILKTKFEHCDIVRTQSLQLIVVDNSIKCCDSVSPYYKESQKQPRNNFEHNSVRQKTILQLNKISFYLET